VAHVIGSVTTSVDVQRHLLRLAVDAAEKADASADQIETFLAADVGHTDSAVIYEENKLELHHYEPAAVEDGPDTVQHGTPVFIVYALVNRPYILDLQPDRSVIRRLLEDGFEVYLVRWGDPSRLDTALGLSDYVCRYLDNCIEAACDHAAVEDLHLLGYCMGGTLSIMYTALMADRVRTLSLMATPIVFEETGGVLEQWAGGFDPGTVVETFGNVPAELLAFEFAMMEPVQNLVTKYVRFFENVEDEEFVANFARMERWTWDGVDVAGTVYREFVDEIYRENNLISGEMEVCGERVDPTAIDVPVLQIVGEYDHIVPSESSKPFNDIVGSDDERLIEFSAGHIGISVSSKAHDRLWPEVCEWYASRSVELDDDA
jgi:polyhydroxyalkanoate synthase